MKNINLSEVNIKGKVISIFGITFVHEFVFLCGLVGDGKLSFDFSMPNKTAIYGFDVICGEKCYHSTIKDIEPKQKNSNSCKPIINLSQNLNNGYSLSIVNLNYFAKNEKIIIKIYSIHLLTENIITKDLSVRIPLQASTKKSDDIQTLTYQKFSFPKISINISADKNDCIINMYSSSHDAVLKENENIISLQYSDKNGLNRSFELCIHQNNRCQNQAYISGDDADGYCCLYRFIPPSENNKKFSGNIIYVLGYGRNKLNYNIAGLALIELIKSQPQSFGYTVCDNMGLVLSETLLGNNFGNITKTELWIKELFSNEKSSEFSKTADNILKKIPSMPMVIYVDAGSGNDYEVMEFLNKNREMFFGINVISILNTVQNPFEKVAVENNGIFSVMRRGNNYCDFAKGFMEMCIGDSFKNLKIMENSFGTFMNIPSEISRVKIGTPITYTMASKTEYPTELFVSADGGYDAKVCFDEIKLYKRNEDIKKIFAMQALLEIKRITDKEELSPRSIIKLKETAIELSKKYNIISDVTDCVVECDDNDFEVENSGGVKISIGNVYEEEFGNTVTQFGDIKGLSKKQKTKLIELCLKKLIMSRRRNGYIADSGSKINWKTQTAYAVQAILSAIENTNIKYKSEYKEVAEKSKDVIGGECFLNSVPILFDGKKKISSEKVERKLKSLNTVEVSRLVLILLFGS